MKADTWRARLFLLLLPLEIVCAFAAAFFVSDWLVTHSEYFQDDGVLWIFIVVASVMVAVFAGIALKALRLQWVRKGGRLVLVGKEAERAVATGGRDSGE